MKLSILEIVLYSALGLATLIYVTLTIKDFIKKKKNKKLGNKEDQE